ncbi:MAG TPA: amidohydrolase family protein [Longimicrobiales bacterium]|nr:amidohydrolase family protein [Longimicrobiales bacterium]
MRVNDNSLAARVNGHAVATAGAGNGHEGGAGSAGNGHAVAAGGAGNGHEGGGRRRVSGAPRPAAIDAVGVRAAFFALSMAAAPGGSMIRRTARLLAACALLATPVSAQIPERGSYAFVNANVIPMDGERVLNDHTVVVQNGRITAVGPAASTAVPAGATRIDARGKFLLPGLAEMHGHIPGGANVSTAEDVLFLYVAAGATTVRGMQGHPAQIELRRRVESGELIGPRMWLAAPQLAGTIDAATASARVRDAKAAGFDLLKVHEDLSAETYAAIVRTAREVGLPWGGHVSQFVGVAGALAAGQSTIDHLDDYLDAMQPENSPALAATGADRVRLLPLHADESRMTALARATRDAGVAVVPTQILWEVLRGARDPATMIDRPENRYMARLTVQGWQNRVANVYANADRAAAQREVVLRNRLLKTMNDEGVLILMGTDAPQLFSVPGFSLYRELPVMVQAGMTPYQVLRSGTVNVAKFFGIEAEAGTIAAGRRADLLLLDANPLTDIRNVERNAGVMVDGRWLSPQLIRQRLDAMAAKHAG